MDLTSMKRRYFLFAVLLFAARGAHSQTIVPVLPQDFAVGADTSFLPQQESQGILFTDAGQAAPALQILKNHGYTWIRLRLMVNPVPGHLPNNLADTLAAAKSAKSLGFKFLLDLHYSDDWADPMNQAVPVAWAKLPHDQLTDQVFTYTRDTIQAFGRQKTMPDMVQIGNEIVGGMMWPLGKLPEKWPDFADFLNAGIRGVDAGHGRFPRPKIMIHLDTGGDRVRTVSFFERLDEYDVAYDVVGLSYYPWWQGTMDDLSNNITAIATVFHKPVIVVETAYDWRNGEDFQGKPVPFPQTAEGQRDYLIALNQFVRAIPGAAGLFWWEPTAGADIAKRSLFDDNHAALPAIHAFDTAPTPAPAP